MEAALAVAIVGAGVFATFNLFANCTEQNRMAARMTVAMMLASNVQEAMGGFTFSDPGLALTYFGPEPGEVVATYDDIDDFDGATLNPPIDALRASIDELTQYSQVVSVWPVRPNRPSDNSHESSPDISKTTYTGAARVRVRILFRANAQSVPLEVYQTSWIRMDR
jgi:hypothetical protein